VTTATPGERGSRALFPLGQGIVRFTLEIVANVGIGRWAHAHGGWVAVVLAVGAALGVWTVFNVPGDPSRGGNAPVPVPGAVRLLVEGAVFTAGALGLWRTAGSAWAAGFAVVTAAHYATTGPRLRFILRRRETAPTAR
jgi:hypothetical protein